MYWLGRYLDPVTLTYILRSSDFDTFCVEFRYLLNYKAYNYQTLQSASSQCTDSAGTLTFNHQTLYSASSRCTDSAGTLTWWPWPIFCTPVTHFTLMFGISSNIKPTTTKPCIVLHLIARAWQVPWPGELDLYLTHFTLVFDNSSTIRSATTISCIVLLLEVLN